MEDQRRQTDGHVSERRVRYLIGADLGAVTTALAVAELSPDGTLGAPRTSCRRHEGRPLEAFLELYQRIGAGAVAGVVATGVHGDRLAPPALGGLPEEIVQEYAARRLLPWSGPAAVVRVGGGGFSVLARLEDGAGTAQWTYEKNDRCSAGTGQATERLCARFGCSLQEAADLAESSADAVALTARCAVFAKSELTHFANQGVEHGRLFRGYFDAVAQTIAAHVVRVAAGLPILLVGNGARIAPLAAALAAVVDVPVTVSTQAAVFDALGALWFAAERQWPARTEWPQEAARLVRGRAARIRALTPAAEGPGGVIHLAEGPKHDDPAAGPDSLAVLGLDLGSTGSKAALVSLDGRVLASVYRRTDGNPVEAAQALVARINEMTGSPVIAVGLTGSGRDAAAAVVRAAFPDAGARIVVQNEIVAHAAAAARLDPDGGRSLSIVEIGGQDAKFISVRDGRVVDSDMNRVCSAGTGSFLEEQATMLGLADIAEFGALAARSDRPADLGQTCTVFVGDLVAEALAEGYAREDIFAGLQYSIVRNYRNRVMGDRRLLDRVFFQGKPASNPSLARTLAAVTGREVLVPPDPGAMGAVGIALLTAAGLLTDGSVVVAPEEALDLRRLLQARVVGRREGRCGDKACGNLCRIETAQVDVGGEVRTIRSGGNCPKYEERSAAGRKLPREAPNPFRERREWLARELEEEMGEVAAGPLDGLTVALPAAHYVMDLAPFFASFLTRLGARVVYDEAGGATLAAGDRLCGAVGACAPVKLAHGLAAAAAQAGCDAVFLPRLVNVPYPAAGAGHSTCPLAQGAPEMVAAAFVGRSQMPPVIMPALLLEEADELSSAATRRALTEAVHELLLRCGADGGRPAKTTAERVRAALTTAIGVQRRYEEGLRAVGERALAFAVREGYPVVAMLGETHVVNDPSLNTGIHDLVAANGALAVPVDCFPPPDGMADLPRVHWASGSAILRIALSARAHGNVFPLLIGAYGCGPNSFIEPLFSDLMEGYPHAVFETDGHGGLAGYVTRVQAFLHAVSEYRATGGGSSPAEPARLARYEDPPAHSLQVGDAARVVFATVGGTLGRQVAATLRGQGVPADFTGVTDPATMRAAQDSCSGKECLPYQLIAGGLQRYFEESPPPAEGTTLFISVGNGFRSCRANVFPVAARLVFERLGLQDRVVVGDLSLLTNDWRVMSVAWAALVAQDLLNALRFRHLAEERTPGDVDGLFETWETALERELEAPRRRDGVRDVLADARRAIARVEGVVAGAARAYAALPRDEGRLGDLRDVLLAGDIFLRVDEWGNDDLQRRLAALGLRVVTEPFSEFFELLAHRDLQEQPISARKHWERRLTLRMMRSIVDRLLRAGQGAEPWLFWHDINELEAASRELFGGLPFGETVSTVGSTLLTWRTQPIDGVVSVAPRGCGPALIAEALLRQRRDIPILYVYNDGDPIEQERLAGFAWRLRGRPARAAGPTGPAATVAPVAAR